MTLALLLALSPRGRGWPAGPGEGAVGPQRHFAALSTPLPNPSPARGEGLSADGVRVETDHG
jgi:hypothetical protein